MSLVRLPSRINMHDMGPLQQVRLRPNYQPGCLKIALVCWLQNMQLKMAFLKDHTAAKHEKMLMHGFHIHALNTAPTCQ